jgi:hypothetical protein
LYKSDIRQDAVSKPRTRTKYRARTSHQTSIQASYQIPYLELFVPLLAPKVSPSLDFEGNWLIKKDIDHLPSNLALFPSPPLSSPTYVKMESYFPPLQHQLSLRHPHTTAAPPMVGTKIQIPTPPSSFLKYTSR